MTTKRQIFLRWFNSDPTLLKVFQKDWKRETVEEYLDEYCYRTDIHEGLAADLGAPASVIEEMIAIKKSLP